MESKPRKPYNIKHKFPSTEALIEEYKEVKNIKMLGIKYGVSSERIRQIMMKNKVAYKEAKKGKKIIYGKTPSLDYLEKYPAFLALVKKMGVIAGHEVIRKHIDLTGHFYELLRKKAESEGFVYQPHYISKQYRKALKIEMLQHLRELGEKLNHTPCSREIDEAGEYLGCEYGFHFGSLANAQKLAGFIPNTIGAQKGNKHGINNLKWKKKRDADRGTKE